MSNNSSDSSGPIVVLAIFGFVAYVGYKAINGVATMFGASFRETLFLLLTMLIATVVVTAALFYDVLQVRIRTAALAWSTVVFACSHTFLSSIANGGLSPDDPMIWHFETTWYSSWGTFVVVLGLLLAATIWSWRQDRYYY